jgi:hypothetical protein
LSTATFLATAAEQNTNASHNTENIRQYFKFEVPFSMMRGRLSLLDYLKPALLFV